MTLNVAMITGRIDVIRTALTHLQDISTLPQEQFLQSHEITDEELYQILQTDLKDFRCFLEEIG